MKVLLYLIIPIIILANYYFLSNFKTMLPVSFSYFPGVDFIFVKTYSKNSPIESWTPFNQKMINQHVVNKMLKRAPGQVLFKRNVCLAKEWSSMNFLKVELWQLQFDIEKMNISSIKIRESDC